MDKAAMVVEVFRQARDYEWARLSLLRAGHYPATEIDAQRARYDAAEACVVALDAYAAMFGKVGA